MNLVLHLAMIVQHLVMRLLVFLLVPRRSYFASQQRIFHNHRCESAVGWAVWHLHKLHRPFVMIQLQWNPADIKLAATSWAYAAYRIIIMAITTSVV